MQYLILLSALLSLVAAVLAQQDIDNNSEDNEEEFLARGFNNAMRQTSTLIENDAVPAAGTQHAF